MILKIDKGPLSRALYLDLMGPIIDIYHFAHCCSGMITFLLTDIFNESLRSSIQ